MKNFVQKQNTQSSTDVQETTDTANEENSVRQELKHIVQTTGITLGSADYQANDPDTTQLAQATARYAMQGDVYRDTSASANSITCERFAGGQLPYPNSNSDFVPIEGDIIRVRVSNTTTGATTLSFYNSADYPVKKRDDTDVTVGFLKANAFYEFLFTDTSIWEVVSESAYASEALEAVTPVGTVQSFYLASAPAGWLEADGAAIDSVKYPKLAALLGTNLPNLQGHSLVGKKTGETLGDNVGEHPYHHRHFSPNALNYGEMETFDSAQCAIGGASTGGGYLSYSYPLSTTYQDANWGAMNNAGTRPGVTYKSGYQINSQAGTNHVPWEFLSAFDYFSPLTTSTWASFTGDKSVAEMAYLGDTSTTLGILYDASAGRYKGYQQQHDAAHKGTFTNDAKHNADFKAAYATEGAKHLSSKAVNYTHKIEKKYVEFVDTLVATGSVVADSRQNKVSHTTVAPDDAKHRIKVSTKQITTSYGFLGTHPIHTQTPKEVMDDAANSGNFDRQYGVGIVWGIKHDY